MLFSGLKPWGEGVHRWLRGELPARAHALELDVAAPTFESAKPRHSLFSFIRAGHATRGRRVLVMQLVGEHFAALNRYPVSAFTRALHALVADRYLRPAVGAVYTTYSKRDNAHHASIASPQVNPTQAGDAQPNAEEPKQQVLLAIEAAQQLTTCYVLIFNALRRIPNRAYAICHDKALRVGHRMLELIHAEQHLCAMLRMKLPERSWRNCNQLYFALNECENVQREMPLAGYLAEPNRAAWQPKERDPAPTSASVQQLYIALQVTGMMDSGTWPPQQFFWMLVYLRRTLPRLKLRPYSELALNDASVIITRAHHRSPTFKMRSKPKEPALLLDVGPLLRRVERDLERLNDGQKDTLFKRLAGVAGVSLLDQAQLLEHMLRKLRYHAERAERSYANQYVELRLHWGFAEAFEIVRDKSNSDEQWRFEDFPVAQQLTKSSTLATEPTAAERSVSAFFLINESASGMQFKYQETSASKAVFIGQLIAYTRDADDPRRSVPQVAYVSRVQRSRSGEVEVAVQKLAFEAECVGVQDPHMQADKKALPGFLLHCLDGKWRFLLHSKHGSYALSKLFLCSAGQSRSLRLGRMYLYQPEFVLFDMIGFEPS